MVRDLIVWAFDHLVLVQLADALEAEGVAAGERDWFLVVVVVRLEANAAFKNLVHLLVRRPVVLVFKLLLVRLLKFYVKNTGSL